MLRLLFRRTPLGIALGLWRLWRRLPAAQRRRLIHAARIHGPRLAAQARERRRTRRLP